MKKIISLAAAVLFGAVSMGVQAADGKVVQIKGSDTLINMVQKLAEVYMQKNPGKAISVTGGGSGTGIAALINKQCDIADSSREIKSKEVDQAKASGIEPKQVVLAIDGISVIVNKDNPVKQLTIEQLGKMYRGEVTNWKDVGGADMPITLYGRQPNSGTYDYFKEDVLKGEYSQQMRQMNGNSQIGETVKQDKSGIGYIGVGYAKNASDVTVLSVAKDANSKYASSLNLEDVLSGVYPIARRLYQYTAGMPEGDVKAFIAFELSEEGQKIVAEEGFFAITAKDKEANKKNIGL